MYEGFRNGFAHSRAPNVHFAIADDRDFTGWAAWVKIGERRGVAPNIDRLAREFLTLLDKCESSNRT
jgi:hypothetical protein